MTTWDPNPLDCYCPSCRAQEGHPCSDLDGRVPRYPCPARTAAARVSPYLGVADELSDPMTSLEDLERAWVMQAQEAATALGLPWPPELAAAEDWYQDHRRAAPAWPEEHGVAWDREPMAPCQRSTPGCCVDHSLVDAPCAPW